ncbi:MAG: hypothetical protein NWF01_05745 [Candidatus Bathyarchaeota archaeon]|nr:hypothetical protein [Candidatus Bathyarchaeota archaeon]
MTNYGYNNEPQGDLQTGDTFNGYKGNGKMSFAYNAPDKPAAITVAGNNVTIENLSIYPNLDRTSQTAIEIKKGVKNCKIQNVMISYYKLTGLPKYTFGKGIVIHPTEAGHTLSHIQMGGGNDGGAVTTGISLEDSGNFNFISIVDVGINLNNAGNSDAGIKLWGGTLNNSCIVSNTWLKANAVDACGIRISGAIKNSFIKQTTEQLDGVSAGYGMVLTPNASVGTHVATKGNFIYNIKVGNLSAQILNQISPSIPSNDLDIYNLTV